jgi:hypothetical protein
MAAVMSRGLSTAVTILQTLQIVIPLKNGTHPSAAARVGKWVPTFVGMTRIRMAKINR